MRGLVADLGAHGTFIFCIPLNCEMGDRFFVFVLQKAEGNKGTTSTPLSCIFRDVLEIYGHSRPGLKQLRNVRIHARLKMIDRQESRLPLPRRGGERRVLSV
jgi:hypothetical protein